MLSHNYHEALARQIGICWERTADDVVWTPLPAVPLQRHHHRRARAARLRRSLGHLPPLLGVELLVRDEPGRRHHHLDARHDGLPVGPRRRPARDAPVGGARGQHLAAPPRRGADAGRGRRRHPRRASGSPRSAAPTASPRPASSPGSRPASATSPTPPGVINDEYFDVRIFDDDDNEVPRGHRRRDRHPAEAPRGDVRRLLGSTRGHRRDQSQLVVPHRRHRTDRRRGLPVLRRPQGRLPAPPGREHLELRGGAHPHGPRRAGRRRGARRAQRPDRGRPQGDGHRGRGRGAHRGGAVPLVHRRAALLRPAPLHRVPRRAAPQSPVGRVLKRELRDEGVTDATWDVEASDVTYDKR